jgi:hypothetical protein
MSDLMDLGQFKQNQNGKWRFIKLGYAKPNPKGGWYLNFDALPLPDEQGRVSVAMKEPQERTDGQGGASSAPSDYARQTRDAGAPDLDDAVPF